MDKVIKVSNCQECVFKRFSSPYEYDYCKISKEVNDTLHDGQDLPHTKVHDLCPLKQGMVIVELENKGDE